MWKTLKPGEKVLPGDTIRYRSDPRHLTSVQDRVYDVVKTDLHYFEIALRCDKECGNEPKRPSALATCNELEQSNNLKLK